MTHSAHTKIQTKDTSPNERGGQPMSDNPFFASMAARSRLPHEQQQPPKKSHPFWNILALLSAIAIFAGLYHLGGNSSRYTWPFTIASVFAHEMGHLIASLITGSRVESLHLSLMPSITYGAEGFVRHTLLDSRLANAAISAAGSFSQVFLGMAFVLCAKRKVPSFLLLGLCLCACALGLFYADDFTTRGIIFALGLIIAATMKFLDGSLLKLFMAFTGIAISAAMLENWRYLFSKEGSDMAHVSDYLFLPVWFWGGLVLLISIAATLLGIWTFVMGEAPKKETDQNTPGIY